MEVKDLMLGDFVEDVDFGIGEVVAIRFDGGEYTVVLSLIDDVTKPFSHVSPEGLIPIPLTPEILEKNGWECFDTYHKYSHYRHPKAPFGILWRKEGGCTIEFKADESGGLAFLFILYVHQLQHALRLCGIEKEIVL